MNYTARLPIFCLFACSISLFGKSTSELWNQFTHAKATDTEPVLADFSYVGYHAGEKEIPNVKWKTFDITDFGAVANDGKSDRKAFIAAIRAAEQNGSGIIYFPKGRFRINDKSDPHNSTIQITNSRIILRGSGSGTGGSEIYIERHMDPDNPNKMWSSPFVIEFRGTGTVGESARIVENAKRETFSVRVSKPDLFSTGDWIELGMIDQSKAAIEAALHPYQAQPSWTKILKEGVEITEFHQIVKVDGDRLVFREPIHVDIDKDQRWKVRSIEPLIEVGAEDLAFVGNWKEKFVHHKSAIHDGGWSSLKFTNCVDGWIRNCRFEDLNRCVSLSGSSGISISGLLLEGNAGHNAVTLHGSSHCLVKEITDTAGHWHANGVAGQCIGNVFLRSEYRSDTCYEAHASQPRWTLFDNISGGWKYGRWGGAESSLPNHLRGLVLWNYKNTGDGVKGEFHFMRPGKTHGKTIMPYVIGFHGNPQEFAEEAIELLESNGEAVLPESLYEAQLELRLGDR